MRNLFFEFLLASLAFSLGSCKGMDLNENRETPYLMGFNLSVQKDQDDSEAANWFVDVAVGEKKYNFYLDTGAGTTSMIWDEWTSQFVTIGTEDTSGAMAKHSNDLVSIPKIRVGSLERSNLTVARAHKEAVGKSNLLGMNFLKDFALEFLFDENKVLVYEKSQRVPAVKFNTLFLGERFHPYVDLKWSGGVQANGVWDTGAGMTVFDIKFVKKHPDIFRKSGSSTGKDSSGKSSETPMYQMKEFELGGYKFPSARVAAVDLSVPNSTIRTPMTFILGYNVLRNANWIFDFPGKRWAISKMLP
jgi:hypothetical protein